MKDLKAIGGETILLDDEDYAEFHKSRWRVDYAEPLGSEARRPNTVRRAVHNGKALGRLITNAPQGMMVDHINGNILDNRRFNLRLCTAAENSRNKRVSRKSVSGFKGVFHNPGGKPWRARITFEGRRYDLGTYKTKLEAHAAYKAEAKRLHGDYAPAVHRQIQASLPDERYIRAALICLWCGELFPDPCKIGHAPGYCCDGHRALDKRRRDNAYHRLKRQHSELSSSL